MSDFERDVTPDRERQQRLGFDEAIFCLNKTVTQIAAIIDDAIAQQDRLLLTRLAESSFKALTQSVQQVLDYDAFSQTAYLGIVPAAPEPAQVAIVCAGTSDVNIAREAVRTLNYYTVNCSEIYDVGVAGLWRLLARVEQLKQYRVIIACAGMDAALPSVLGGLLPGLIIAVPTSTGYGVASGGHSALNAVLASCAPGIVVVNIDNGYGAACAALRALNN